jgi:Tfp pilus assembly protein PilV
MKRIVFKTNKRLKAFSLAEIIVSIGVFSIIAISIGTLIVETIRFSENRWLKSQSILMAKEIINGVNASKNDLWKYIAENTNGGKKYIQYTNETYNMVNGELSQNGFTSSFQIYTVQRDSNGFIVQSGGVEDINTRRIEVSVSWVDTLNNTNTFSTSSYVTNWNTLDWKQTTQAEFNSGTFTNNTVSDALGGGAVRLQQIIYPDWCNPSLALNQYDLPGNSVSKTVFALTGNAYLGTAGTNQSTAMTKLTITGVTPPVITVNGTFGGYAVNDVFIVGNIAYLATNDDGKEVVILDVSQTPFTEIGYFNATGNQNGRSIFFSGTTGYVATAKKVQSFNLTSNTGSRPKYDEITLSLNQNQGATSYIAQVVVRGNYLFASLNEDYYEMAIANVSNPSNMSLVSSSSVNDQQTTDIEVSSDGSRAYFGTNSSSQREFYIMNTSNKSNPTTISSYDTTGMSVTGLAIIPADGRAILVGKNGQEYQAVNISNENSISKCGGMDINNGIEDVDSVIDAQGNAFAYLVTADNSAEFKILRGGPGGGNGSGTGYPTNGSYTSQVFDTGATTTVNYYTLKWTSQLAANSTVRFQVRAHTSNNFTGINWIGPDGTSATYFTNANGETLPTSLQNKRYFQYITYFTSDTFNTPYLLDMKLNYQK